MKQATVFGIYKGDMDGWYLQQPLYSTKEKAIAEALKIVEKEQQETVEMQEHTKNDTVMPEMSWNSWRQKEGVENQWIGGFCDDYTVQVDEIDVL